MIQFLQLLDFISTSIVGAILIKQQLINSNTISYSLITYSLASIGGSLFVGRITQHSTKKTLIILLFLFAISQLILGIKISELTFILSKTLGGATGGLMGSIAYSQLGNIDAGKNTGLWNGRIQTAQSLVSIIGLPLSILTSSQLGPQVYFFFMFGMSLIIVIKLSTTDFISETQSHRPKVDAVFLVEHADIFATGLVCYLSAFLFVTHLANYLTNAQNASSSKLSLAYSLSGVITILFSGSIGKIADNKNSKLLLSLALGLTIIPQIIFNFSDSTNILLFIALPTYLLFSTAVAIYQRGIILARKEISSFSLHLLNAIAIRIGILISGIILSGLLKHDNNLSNVFKLSTKVSIIFSLGSILLLSYKTIFRRFKN